jgi:hypothetical protein
MSTATTYTGGCHCGKVRYEVTMTIGQAVECNCSICSKKGHLLSFVPASSFKLLQGEDELTDYQFNKKHIHHLFCRTCGIQSYATGKGKDGNTMYSINVRCLDGVDPQKVQIQHFDGKSM